MARLRRISRSEYVRSHWKNGLGFTDQIAIEPAGADLRKGDYLWRISSAAIENASDFSVFPEHDRGLVILSGAGVRLTHRDPDSDYSDTVELPPFEPYEFPGDIKSSCGLVDGPVQDLSVFFKKSDASASLDVVVLDGESAWDWNPRANWNFVFAARGAFEIATGGEETETLAPGETYLIEPDPGTEDTYPIVAHGPDSRLVVISLWLNG